jgi:hypothetical protein
MAGGGPAALTRRPGRLTLVGVAVGDTESESNVMRHVVMFSGGIGSWAAAKRAAERYGTTGLTLLFADTKREDEDTYRFLHEAAADVGGTLVTVADGRTPFEVFRAERFLGNTRKAKCSLKLKVEPCRRWLAASAPPGDTALVVGIDWSEIHRLPAIREHWAPYPVTAPLAEAPYLAKGEIVAMAKATGLNPPACYAEGLPHANCLAQGCVKGGQAYWRHLLKTRPEVYRRTEREEADLAAYLGKDVAILRDRRGGKTVPLPLAEFRRRVEAGGQGDLFEWGGCGCFTDAGDYHE